MRSPGRVSDRHWSISTNTFWGMQLSALERFDGDANRLSIAVDILSNMANIANTMNALTVPIDPILSALPAVDASTVKNRYRDVAVLAAKGAIAISRYTRPELVIMPAAEYVRLERARRAPLDQLAGEFDGLVAKMQASKSKKAVHALFGAKPADLGKAAVKAAKANAS